MHTLDQRIGGEDQATYDGGVVMKIVRTGMKAQPTQGSDEVSLDQG